eukprot:3706604-Alexandrium_andersonii.AAC.1
MSPVIQQRRIAHPLQACFILTCEGSGRMHQQGFQRLSLERLQYCESASIGSTGGEQEPSVGCSA